jgi:hypothetical protein
MRRSDALPACRGQRLTALIISVLVLITGEFSSFAKQQCSEMLAVPQTNAVSEGSLNIASELNAGQ